LYGLPGRVLGEMVAGMRQTSDRWDFATKEGYAAQHAWIVRAVALKVPEDLRRRRAEVVLHDPFTHFGVYVGNVHHEGILFNAQRTNPANRRRPRIIDVPKFEWRLQPNLRERVGHLLEVRGRIIVTIPRSCSEDRPALNRTRK